MATAVKGVMKYGMGGPAVAEAQKMLKAAGSKIQITGKWTIGMTSAVKAFQRRNDLKVTGMIDAKTLAKLNEYKKPARKKAAK